MGPSNLILKCTGQFLSRISVVLLLLWGGPRHPDLSGSSHGVVTPTTHLFSVMKQLHLYVVCRPTLLVGKDFNQSWSIEKTHQKVAGNWIRLRIWSSLLAPVLWVPRMKAGKWRTVPVKPALPYKETATDWGLGWNPNNWKFPRRNLLILGCLFVGEGMWKNCGFGNCGKSRKKRFNRRVASYPSWKLT